MRIALPRSRWVRLALVVAVLATIVALIGWRVELGFFTAPFRLVRWEWVAAAVGINFLSVVVRAVSWKIVVDQAVTPPRPRHRSVFAAYCVGLLGNATLPGRVGELARVAVLTRRMRRRPGTWATVLGTVFAHRLFDIVVASALIVFVVYAAPIPTWARPMITIFLGVGLGLVIAGLLLARRRERMSFEDVGPLRRILRMARHGLRVLKRPFPAAVAQMLQVVGWAAQLLAVWATFRAFGIEGSLTAAALVLVIMNLVFAFPLWPGNVGLVQAAVALSLLPYGVSYGHGFAFGVGVQAIEASVGIALGLVFLAREGFSFAMLRQMSEYEDVEEEEPSRLERIA